MTSRDVVLWTETELRGTRRGFILGEDRDDFIEIIDSHLTLWEMYNALKGAAESNTVRASNG